jgi:PKD repeat protein
MTGKSSIRIKNQFYFFVLVPMLVVSMLNSCVKEATNTPPTPPNASFTFSSSRVFPVQVQFINLSTNPFPGSSTFIWDFGDGGVSAALNPVHAYADSGTFNVKLIQLYPNNTRDTVVKSLQITRSGPSGISTTPSGVSATDFSYTIPVVYLVSFTNTSTNAVNYVWNFGDNSTSTSLAPAITHQYNASGPFTIILQASGPGGTDTCSARISF